MMAMTTTTKDGNNESYDVSTIDSNDNTSRYKDSHNNGSNNCHNNGHNDCHGDCSNNDINSGNDIEDSSKNDNDV